MRYLSLLFASVLPLVASCKTAEALPSSPPASGPGVAVVELFSSEGCSSCPPADEVLSDLVRKGDGRVFPLAFHVDYWDDLGWADPFASAQATARQREYAASFGTSSVFTPQMIVDGTEAFVGSDASHARDAITRALARAPSTRLTVTAERADAQSLRVHYRFDPAPKDGVLRLALVERGLVTRVPRGENAGRTLAHENVVRSFVTVPIHAAEGTAVLPVPSSVDRRRAEVIGYVQSAPRTEGRGVPITAAARTPAP
ncbi:DUF1223 domain-containing protein [Pendulispora albinea]|uniref:DUF1223 domain-containing protein n=1 Tax=Pendulispora albinea TaxID=2741071 RepID=A0ABZ2LSR5_9BACT